MIYGWLLVGLVPVWICGLAERFLEQKEIVDKLFPCWAGRRSWRHFGSLYHGTRQSNNGNCLPGSEFFSFSYRSCVEWSPSAIS